MKTQQLRHQLNVTENDWRLSLRRSAASLSHESHAPCFYEIPRSLISDLVGIRQGSHNAFSEFP